MDAESFLVIIRACVDAGKDEDIALHCIRFLRFEANDHGKDGKTIKNLLDIVSDLLEA